MPEDAFPNFDSAEAAWRSAIATTLDGADYQPGVTEPTSIGSNFGRAPRPFIEQVGAGFALSNPRARLVISNERSMDLGFALAAVFWAMSARNDSDSISAFNPRGQHFADAGTLIGAPGHRIFGAARPQLLRAISRLRNDPTTRRAVLVCAEPDDFISEQRDVPCMIAMQYLLRRGRLHCCTFMRSQSVVMVLPYDLFLHTMIHELIAVSIGADLGRHIHICGSMHLYDDEALLARRILATPQRASVEMPPMQPLGISGIKEGGRAFGDVATWLQNRSRTAIEFSSYGLSDYWTRLLRILVAIYDCDVKTDLRRDVAQWPPEWLPLLQTAGCTS